jgi:GAF domain-containing protein
LATRVEIDSKDELGELSSAFNTMASQLHHLIGTLDEQVTARTRQLETVMEISQRLAIILDLSDLLRQVVILTKETFNYYHVHIYLLDKSTKLLLLAEGYGQTGAEMKSRGHSIALDAKQSLVALAARNNQIVKVDNVRERADWLPTPLLPDTQSEIAIPIILEAEVVGILDVQENEIAGLDEGDLNLLRSLANQVAVAIRNAQQFEAVEAALTDARAAQELFLEQAWQKAKLTSPDSQYLYKEAGMAVVDDAQRQMFVKARKEALTTSRPRVVSLEDSSSARKALVAPINLRGKPIGDVQLYTSDPGAWTEDNLALIEIVLDQLAQSAENLRLFEETRERASREQTIREITDKLRTATSLEELVQITSRELGEHLSAEHAVMELGLEPELNSTSASELAGNGQHKSKP